MYNIYNDGPSCHHLIKDSFNYCPLCGIQLIRDNYKGVRKIIESDKDDWMSGYFMGDGT